MRKIIITSLFVLCASNVFAQEASEIIVITATKSKTPINKIGSSISAITEAEIQERQPTQVLDILKATLGVSYSSNGSYGQPASVRIRGAEPEHTQVIYDGVRLADSSSTAGGFDFADLMIADCERIEVLKGPQSSLYGSDAIGGVVNITSRLPKEPFEYGFDLEYGSLNTSKIGANIGGKLNKFSYNINTNTIKTDGISALAKENGGREKDPYNNSGIIGNFNYELNQYFNFDLKARIGKSKANYDAGFDSSFRLIDSSHYNHILDQQYYFGINNNYKNLSQTLAYRDYTTDREYFNPKASIVKNGDYLGKLNALDYNFNYSIADSIRIIGGASNEKTEYKFSNPSSFNPNPKPSTATAELSSIYIEAQAEPTNKLNATLGIRYDDHSQYGDNVSLRSTLSYRPQKNTVIRFSYGDGFKAPSLYQLYSEYGNTDLKPEISSAYEFGLRQKIGSFILDASYFNRETENQIGWFPCWPDYKALCDIRPFGFYDNIAKTKTTGYEAQLKGKLYNFYIDLGISQIDPKNASIGDLNNGKIQPRRPKDQVKLNIGYDLTDRFYTSLEYLYNGKSYDNPSNSVVLKEYNLIALRANYKLNDNISVYGRIENLTDKVYQTAYSYGNLPRTFTIGLRTKF